MKKIILLFIIFSKYSLNFIFAQSPLINTEQQNQRIIQENQRQSRERQEQINELRKELDEIDNIKTINYNFPSLKSNPQIYIYKNIYASIDSILNFQKTTSLKKIIFEIENTFYNNQLSYTLFNKKITYIVDVCKQKMAKENIALSNREAVNMIIYQVLCDTVEVQNPKTLLPYKSYPYKYDFEDFMGENDFSKMFVTKLLKSHKGNCKSMPLLYLIIADELKTDAYLCYAPSHSFVRFQDNKYNWINIELTNGRLGSDAWMLGSGYIKAEALNKQIYLDTINKTQLIASLLCDLAEIYTIKIGFDDFYLKCINRSLEVFPNNILAIMKKSDYYTLLLKYIVEQKGRPSVNQLQQDKKANEVFIQRNIMYEQVDNSGYEPMPKEVYQTWRNSVEKQSKK